MPYTSISGAMRVRSGGSRVAHLVTKKGRAYTLGLTPEQAQLGGLAYGLQQLPRPGRKSLVRESAPALATLTFNHMMLATPKRALLGPLRSLMNLARGAYEIRVIGVSDIESKQWWRIQDLGVQIVERDEGQQAKQVQLNWSLIEAYNVRAKIGRTPPPGAMFKADLAPISAIAYTPGYGEPGSGSSYPEQRGRAFPDYGQTNPADNPANTPGGSSYDSQVPQGRMYDVVAGDTLFSVTAQVWGNGGYWVYLYTANRDSLKWDNRLNVVGTMPTQSRFLAPGLRLKVPGLPSNAKADNGAGWA